VREREKKDHFPLGETGVEERFAFCYRAYSFPSLFLHLRHMTEEKEREREKKKEKFSMEGRKKDLQYG